MTWCYLPRWIFTIFFFIYSLCWIPIVFVLCSSQPLSSKIDAAFTSPWRPHTDGPSSFSISLHCDHFLFCAPPSLIFLEIVCFIIILLILPFLLWSSFPFIRNDRPCHCLWPSRAPTLALRILEYHRIANLIPGMVFSPKKLTPLLKFFFIV